MSNLLFYVDDDANDLLLFRDACKHAKVSFSLETASDGEQAITHLQRTFSSDESERLPLPSIILLDIKMPRLSGFELLEWIRSQPLLRTVPVVMFTSSKHAVDVQKAYELGASSYLVKTVDYRQLIEIVKVIDQYWFALNQNTASARV